MEVKPDFLASHFSPQHPSQWKALILAPMGVVDTFKRLQYPVQMLAPKVQWGQNDCCQRPFEIFCSQTGNCGASQERRHQICRKLCSIKGVLFNLFPCSKAGWQLYPILDVRQLDEVIKVPCFPMLRTAHVLQAVSKEDSFMGINLKDAYFHVPEAAHHRQFLRFKGQVYHFQVLPFRLLLAPRILMRRIAAALSPLQARGMQIHSYLNDRLICAPAQEQAICNTTAILAHLTQLGLTMNFAKSFLVPSQRIMFIGLPSTQC